MAGVLKIDESRFPLVVVSLQGETTPDMHATFFARIDAWNKGRRRYAVLLDISGSAVPSAAERKRMAEGMATREAGLKQFCAGTSFVLTSSVLRGAVTAVLWLHPIAQPHAVVATAQEGRALCAGWLASEPLSIR